MRKLIALSILLSFAFLSFAQSLDAPFSKDKMRKDLEVFKQIRIKANSGLYKYRSVEQIDSIYKWAEKEVEISNTYLDFYNIICQLTDFEGSCHNSTSFSKKQDEYMSEEESGYFPYPIKWIDGKWRINFDKGKIPLGAELLEINNINIDEVMQNLYKYYTTDGVNLTGKRIGLRRNFAEYYRWHYGRVNTFKVKFKSADTEEEDIVSLKGLGYKQSFNNVLKRYSRPYDTKYYSNLAPNEKYKYEQIDSNTGVLSIHDFGIGGNADDPEHKRYAAFLDSIFINIKTNDLKNLIVDVRINSGGTDPNDVITYSYLTSRNFQESKEAWISFQKLPFLKYYDSPFPRFIRPLGVGKYNKQFRARFPIEKDGKFHIGRDENEMMVRTPNQNNFTGNIYLLISPAVASAGSLFASLVAGNENTIVIGEETLGGYYGHNGHTPLEYVLPKSKFGVRFFMDNIEQDVPFKPNQLFGRGIMPDHEVSQSLEDFLQHADTQMNFTLELIKNK
jgi:hypothetical protein